MDTFEHDGIEMAYEKAGDGPSVLFLHNGGTSHTIWRNQVAALADRYGPVAVDLPGFGESPRPPAGIDLGGYVDVVTAFVREQTTTPIVIVGNCMGANIATAVAAAAPDAVAGLVLVNPLTEATFSSGAIGVLHKMDRWIPGPTAFVRNAARRVVPPRIAAEMTLRMQVGPKGVAAGIHHDPELIACNRRRDQLPALVDILNDMAAYGELDRSAGDLQDVPTWTIWGSGNRILSAGVGRTLGESIRPSRAESLGGCGHLVMLEEPAEVTGIIEDFLAEYLPVGGDVATAAAEKGSGE